MARRRPRGRTDGAPIAPRVHARGPGRLSCGHHLHRLLCRWRGCVGCQCAQPWHLPVAAACTARYCRRPPPAGQDGFALPDAVPSRIRTQSPSLRWSRPPTWGTIASLSDTPPHAIAHRSSFQAAPPDRDGIAPTRASTWAHCRTVPHVASFAKRDRPCPPSNHANRGCVANHTGTARCCSGCCSRWQPAPAAAPRPRTSVVPWR